MATLIKERRVVANPPSLPSGREEPREEQGTVLRLEPQDDLSLLTEKIKSAARVEVNFPKFGDGRGFSIARLLRERYGYKGELRAVGHVVRDHLHYMESCGFDAYQLKDGEDAAQALAGFDDFSESYQASAARPLPLFRRRA
jgi:uncharacterized protein (DUF934 family)